jgi:hypothetical protein
MPVIMNTYTCSKCGYSSEYIADVQEHTCPDLGIETGTEEPYCSAYEYLKSNIHNYKKAGVSVDIPTLLFNMEIALGKMKLEVTERLSGSFDLASLAVQVGGSHYKQMGIQPWEIIAMNDLDFWEGNALKYLLRYKTKNGAEDLKKISHYVQYLIEREENKS